jgi:sugar transferase (PEP-CTERM/EpsH1 system associated)
MSPPSLPIRVMHVVFSLQPGGMEHGVVKLVNGLEPARFQSAICSTTPGGALRPMVKPERQVIELRRRPGNDPRLVWDLYQMFRRERPHIVHTHAWGTLCEGLVAARLARVPLVVHGEHGTLQLKPYQARVQRVAWRHVNRLLSVSSRLAERMAATTGFPVERIQVIRNGVDLSRFGTVARAAARQWLGFDDAAVVIGTAGRLVPVKDQRTLLDAAATLHQRSCHVSVLLAGDGPLLGELQAHAHSRGLSDHVRFLGHRPDIERVFAALDIFVLSSVSEGLSNTILEAMASGLPVVATRVGGADELVLDGVTGLLVPPQSAAVMADAIEALTADPERRRVMAAAASRRAFEEFAIDRMLQNYASFYQSIAQELSNAGQGSARAK